MSHSESYYYRLQRQREREIREQMRRAREQANRNRVSANVREFLGRYKETLNRMYNEGLDRFVSVHQLESDINAAYSYINSDPFYARDISVNIGSYIRELETTARNLKREHIQFEREDRIRRERAEREREKQERIRREELEREAKEREIQLEKERIEEERRINEEKNANKDKVIEHFYNIIREIKDPILIDFAKDEIDGIKTNIFNAEGLSNEEAEKYKNDISNNIKSIIERAEVKAQEYKAKKQKEKENKLLDSKLEDIQLDLIQNIPENKEDIEKKEKLLKQIENARKSLSSDNAENITSQEIESITEEAEELLITEEVRKEVVKSIIKSLKSNDFTVQAPELIKDDNGGIVKIIAKRPSGKRAVCKVGLNGKLEYTFDNYEGLTCINDIDKFNKDLEEVYSIKLSDKKVLWENPDRISKGAIDINNIDKRTL